MDFAHGLHALMRLHGGADSARVLLAISLSMSQSMSLFARRSHMKRLIAVMLLAMFSTTALTACNTMAGAGKDVQKVGEKVEQKAEDCKDAEC